MLGERAGQLGRRLGEAARARGVAAAIAPAAPDLRWLAGLVDVPVLAQHVDPLDAGPATGYTPAEAIAAAGAVGSLVNHSEHPLSDVEVGRAVQRLVALGLVPVVCARDLDVAAELAQFRPPYLAVEPPELIGGPVSVSSARPELLSGAVEVVHAVSPGTAVLCGAGIRSGADVRRALELGTDGVLVASAVTLARDPAAALRELLSGFPEGSARS